jgi:cobalamin-dependent methionine synthase I
VFHGIAGEPLAGTQWVAAFIATAGPGVESLSRDLMADHQVMAGMIVDAVGAERAESAAKSVFQTLRLHVEPSGLGVSIPVFPGQCGFDLQQQTPLFALFGHQTAGVRLTPDLLMQPLKSVSGLVGIGPAAQIVSEGTPCDRCDRPECTMRR